MVNLRYGFVVAMIRSRYGYGTAMVRWSYVSGTVTLPSRYGYRAVLVQSQFVHGTVMVFCFVVSAVLTLTLRQRSLLLVTQRCWCPRKIRKPEKSRFGYLKKYQTDMKKAYTR